MKNLTISKKITLWYMAFMVVIAAVLITVLLQFYDLKERHTVERKLMRVVEETGDAISESGEEFIFDHRIRYYTNGIYLSVYSVSDESDSDADYNLNNSRFICGRRPRGFGKFPRINPEEFTVMEDSGGNEWYIYDTYIYMTGDREIYVRGMINNVAYEDDYFVLMFYTAAIPILVLLAAAGGWLITNRTLKPLREIIDTANDIREKANLSLRIPVPDTKDELRELSEAFNGMFDTIEGVVQSEKQFTSDVSHELRTPVTVIRSQSEYAMEDPEYAVRAAEVINRESKRLGNLISNLLTLARSDAGMLRTEQETVDLAELLDGISFQSGIVAEERGVNVRFINETVGSTAELNTESDTSLDSEMPEQYGATGGPDDNTDSESSAEDEGFGNSVMIQSDIDILMRIMINLVDNAVKYGKSPGGTVTVSLRTDGTEAVCTVSDDGEGIAPENRDKIWQRFYRADMSRNDDDSTGLGLAMASSLAKAIGGKLRYVDEEDRRPSDPDGAVFELRLPLHSTQP